MSRLSFVRDAALAGYLRGDQRSAEWAALSELAVMEARLDALIDEGLRTFKRILEGPIGHIAHGGFFVGGFGGGVFGEAGPEAIMPTKRPLEPTAPSPEFITIKRGD